MDIRLRLLERNGENMALITDSIEAANTAGGANLLKEFLIRIKDWMLEADLGYEVEEDVNENPAAVYVFVLKHTETEHYISIAASTSASTFRMRMGGLHEANSGEITNYEWSTDIGYSVSKYHFKCNAMLAKHDSNNFIISFLSHNEKSYFYHYGVSQTIDIEGNILDTYVIKAGSSSGSCIQFSKIINQQISSMRSSYEALGYNKQTSDLERCIIQPAILTNYGTNIVSTTEIPKYMYNIILPSNIKSWTLVEISGSRYLILNYPNFAYKVD